MKCSGACAALSSGSAADRHRSGSGPRYSISLAAVSDLKNGGTSAGKALIASRLIMRCPSLPHAQADGGSIPTNNSATRAADAEKRGELLNVRAVEEEVWRAW